MRLTFYLLLFLFCAADLSDSGRYGVLANNPAGRAECLADVMVTELIMQQAPPQAQRLAFSDVSQHTAKVGSLPSFGVSLVLWIIFLLVWAEHLCLARKVVYSQCLYFKGSCIPIKFFPRQRWCVTVSIWRTRELS